MNPSLLKEARLSPVEAENQQANVSEPVIGIDPPPDLSAQGELLVVAEETLVSSIGIETEPVDAPRPRRQRRYLLRRSADVEPTVLEDTCVALADSDVSAGEVSEGGIDSDAFPVVAMEIEPVPANDPAPIATIAAKDSSADTASAVTHVAPEPVLEFPLR